MCMCLLCTWSAKFVSLHHSPQNCSVEPNIEIQWLNTLIIHHFSIILPPANAFLQENWQHAMQSQSVRSKKNRLTTECQTIKLKRFGASFFFTIFMSCPIPSLPGQVVCSIIASPRWTRKVPEDDTLLVNSLHFGLFNDLWNWDIHQNLNLRPTSPTSQVAGDAADTWEVQVWFAICKDGHTGWFLPFALQLAVVTLPVLRFASGTKGLGDGPVEIAVHVCKSAHLTVMSASSLGWHVVWLQTLWPIDHPLLL